MAPVFVLVEAAMMRLAIATTGAPSSALAPS